jgi:hypothetical protein
MSVYLSNLQPDPQDDRDYLFEIDPDAILPDAVDLSVFGGQIEDQLSIGSCTANATVSACELFMASAGLFSDTPETDELDLSRRFNYYTSRQLLGAEYLTGDPGSTARSALRAANKLGLPSERICKYDVKLANVAPEPEAYADAEKRKIGEYRRITIGMNDEVIHSIMYALAKGWPVAVGLQVGHKLRDLPASEPYPFLHPTNNPYWGNHEMLIVGYKRLPDRVLLKIENSWGSDWCESGYFWTSALVVVVDVIDLWVVQGFAGIERVGVDRAAPKPIPAPVVPEVTPPPAPVAPPVPEPAPPTPEPVPPQPIPDPAPQPSNDSSSLPLIIGVAAVIAFLIYRFGGFTS